MTEEQYFQIALTTLPGMGSRSVRQLLSLVDSPRELFSMQRSELEKIFGPHPDIINAIINKSTFNLVDQEVGFSEKNHINVHFCSDPDFPFRLNLPDCIDSPALLYSLGHADLNPGRSVSIVGTRRATPEGIDITNNLVNGFRGEGITVVSGLALGIDAASHAAAIANSLPTIAVLAHGLNQLYPPQNRQLAKRILEKGGTLLTEMRSTTKINPRLFPARNRIIAGLGDATVVVEASRRGGALITANIAASYHRELFAFPGRINDKYSEGCNAIIASSKAMLIRNSDDVFFNMGWRRTSPIEGKQTSLFPELEGDEKTVYKILADNPGISIDLIPSLVDLPMPKIATALLNLELKNICRCLPGRTYKLI